MKYTLISILFVFILGCSVKGKRGNSMSIEESKSRKVFLFEYSILQKGEVNFSLNKVFIEKAWIYNSLFNDDIIRIAENIPYSYQIIIILNSNNNLIGFNESWNINVNNLFPFERVSDFDCLVSWVSESCLRDTIVLNIQEGNKYLEKTDNIGEIILIRKSNN